jgi:hypothetical protein
VSTTEEAVKTFEVFPAASEKLPAAIVNVHEPVKAAGGVNVYV